MKILGVDFGLRKIGLASADEGLVQPFGVIINTPGVIAKIERICQEQGIEKIVVGLPESGIVNQVKRFAKNLARITSLPVVFQDEVLTSKEAIAKMIEAGHKRKFRRQKEDAAAAALILQSWIDKINV